MLQKQILTTAMLKRWSHEIMQMQPQTGRESVSEGLLFNSAIYQLYHGQIKFIFNENDVYVRFALDQNAELDFYSASSLKQQSVERHVTLLRHISLILSQPVFAYS